MAANSGIKLSKAAYNGGKSHNSWIVSPAKFKYTGVYGVWNSFWIAEVITASFSYIMVRRMFKRMP